MGRVAIDLVELVVGLGCLALGAGAWRAGGGVRVVGLVLGAAGLAAIAHAIGSLAS